MEHSELLAKLLAALYETEMAYCVTFKAISQIYGGPDGISNMPEHAVISCVFASSNEIWHSPVHRNDALRVAPFLLGSQTVITAMFVTLMLDHFLIQTCLKTYPAVVDRTWFNFEMIEVASGINPVTCARWADVQKLYAMRDVFYELSPQTKDTELNQPLLFKLIASVKVFAIDFEAAFMLAHPEVKS